VHSNDGAIRHAKAALNAVTKAVAIFRTQVAFSDALVGTEANADSADKAAKNQDLTSTTDYYQKAVTELSQCQLLVKDADVAPQFAPLVEAYSKVMKDVAGLADTVRANDGGGALAYLRQLIADDTVIYFDQIRVPELVLGEDRPHPEGILAQCGGGAPLRPDHHQASLGLHPTDQVALHRPHGAVNSRA
jgi:hypothetical protein